MNIIERAKELRKFINKVMQELEDDKALQVPELYNEWKTNTHYKQGEKLRFDGVLYKCLQSHQSQANWTPKEAVSLFAEVLIPDPDQTPEWVQPSAVNPYMRGDKVKHNGETWESLINNNVWEPGIPGTENLWKKI